MSLSNSPKSKGYYSEVDDLKDKLLKPETSLDRKKENIKFIEDKVNEYILQDENELKNVNLGNYISDEEDRFFKENSLGREDSICDDHDLKYEKDNLYTSVNSLINKITLFLNYLAKFYGANSYFDIWNKITSSKWETFVIYKVARKALKKIFKKIKSIKYTKCIYQKLNDEKIAEIYIDQFISILKYNDDFLKKTGEVLAGPFAGLELLSALPNQLIKITDASNFNIMKVLETDKIIIKEYFTFLFGEFNIKEILNENDKIEFNSNLILPFNKWFQDLKVQKNIQLINKEIEKISNYRMGRRILYDSLRKSIPRQIKKATSWSLRKTKKGGFKKKIRKTKKK